MGEDRTPIYEAQFSPSPISDVDPYLSGRNNNVLLTVILPIASVVMFLLIVFFIVKRVLKKRKMAKRVMEASAQSNAKGMSKESTDKPMDCVDTNPMAENGGPSQAE